jgi:hypothetical protein
VGWAGYVDSAIREVDDDEHLHPRIDPAWAYQSWLCMWIENGPLDQYNEGESAIPELGGVYVYSVRWMQWMSQGRRFRVVSSRQHIAQRIAWEI